MRTNSINGDSNSTHGSDLSATVLNPNSSDNTPIHAQFPADSTNSTDSSYAQDTEDVEDDLDMPVPGWPRVAMLMSKTPDFASFSRFRDLNIKSLLYYQAELTKLKKKLHEQEWEDYRRGDDKARSYADRADYLINSKKKDCHEQWKLVQEIRVVLKEYNEALLQYSQVSALPEPESYNMKSFRMWLRDRDAGRFSIGGNGEQNTWGDLYEKEEDPGSLKWQFVKLLWSLIWPRPPPSNDLDLVATRRPQNIDGFTRWVASDFIPFYTHFRKRREIGKTRTAADEEKVVVNSSISTPPSKSALKKEFHKGTLATYSESSMLKFTSAVSTVVACLLPTVAIVVLSQVQGIRNLLLCLAGFAVIFSVGLIFLTSGTTTRVEIFTATAAFSAVLVVFISTPAEILQK